MANKTSNHSSSTLTNGLGDAAKGLAGALGKRALSSTLEHLEGSTDRLQDFANGDGSSLKTAITGVSKVAEGESPGKAAMGAGFSGLKEKAKNLLGGGGGGKGGGGDFKVTNIVEDIDIPAPVRLVYDQWTQFADFPNLMKKVETVEQEEDEKVNWRAQILWSHRDWEATIDKQIPDSLIAWTSKGSKGHVDGTVMFREVGPELTRVLVVLEYHPQGFFEHTGNLWRAQGRRVRLELKHFRRHVMRQLVLNPDELEGWRGVIEDGEVVKDHEAATEEEQRQGDEQDQDGPEQDDSEQDGSRRGRGSARKRGREPADAEDEYEDYDDEEEPEYEDAADEAEDEYDDYDEEEDEEPEDEELESDKEPERQARPRRRPVRAGSKGGRS